MLTPFTPVRFRHFYLGGLTVIALIALLSYGLLSLYIRQQLQFSVITPFTLQLLRQDVAWLERLELALLLLMLLTLALELFFVFRPMERRIQTHEQALRADMARQHSLTAALAHSEEKLRLITDHVHDLILQTDAQHVIAFASPSARALLGYEPAALRGRSLTDLLHPDDLAAFAGALDVAAQSRANHFRAEVRLRHADGQDVWLETTGRLIYDEPGNFSSVYLGRDTSVRRQMETLLREQSTLRVALEKEQELGDLKSRMMERITHEFRTPLTVVQIAIETLLHYSDRLSAERKQDKEILIKKHIQRIVDMLDEINLVVRNDFLQSSSRLHPTRFVLADLCREIATALEAQFDLPGKYHLALPPALMLRADRGILSYALLHILRNAARFSPPDAPVVVTAAPDAGGLRVTITNQGTGILPAEQARVFEPFFRGSNIGEISGLGLGLTIARAAVVAHGGHITLASVPGATTRFDIWLPGAEDA
ncbi:MAG: PAS domain-containing sensor histidine kinase [Anaerolineae bacterium]|nr:PAS domain-containing sensor histidine kinase [Anaerolineae bacterium]